MGFAKKCFTVKKSLFLCLAAETKVFVHINETKFRGCLVCADFVIRMSLIERHLSAKSA